MVVIDFNAEEVSPSTGFEPIPLGKYHAVITESEMRDTKSGNGKYLQLTFEVIEGKYANRKIFERLNIINPNQQAKEIALSNLSSICHCAGVLHVKDSSELHNKPMIINVGIRPANGQYPANNEIKGYESLRRNAAAPAQVQPAPQAETKPWETF